MPLEIERGIPVPPHPTHRPRYPFRRMEPGDSFVVPLEGREPIKVQRSLHGSACQQGVRIRTRTVAEGGEASAVRVWLLGEKEATR